MAEGGGVSEPKGFDSCDEDIYAARKDPFEDAQTMSGSVFERMMAKLESAMSVIKVPNEPNWTQEKELQKMKEQIEVLNDTNRTQAKELQKMKEEMEVLNETNRTQEKESCKLKDENTLLENICLKLKKRSRGVFGRKMEERKVELDKMKRKMMNPQRETCFLRRMFRRMTHNKGENTDADITENSAADISATAVDLPISLPLTMNDNDDDDVDSWTSPAWNFHSNVILPLEACQSHADDGPDGPVFSTLRQTLDCHCTL
ncbi:hypothetical protein EYF80_036584 [Liparis tanakae]|uniref:Uncharacterized protein n=1 Tax=Liparis tanakae TaxID=230148 RepID=A0A4Z2GK33_9TELE|nr:hypothetical protein EYF80_036584 [Liparis tanakae]